MKKVREFAKQPSGGARFQAEGKNSKAHKARMENHKMASVTGVARATNRKTRR